MTCDNAAAILKAFRIDNIPIYGQTQQLEESQIEESNVKALFEEGDLDFEADGVAESQLMVPLERNACLAHLAQLAIKDAICGQGTIKALIKRAGDIVTFFHRSNHYYTSLREINGNRSVLKPCVTRWNSQHACLQRFVEDVEGKVSEHFHYIELFPVMTGKTGN